MIQERSVFHNGLRTWSSLPSCTGVHLRVRVLVARPCGMSAHAFRCVDVIVAGAGPRVRRRPVARRRAGGGRRARLHRGHVRTLPPAHDAGAPSLRSYAASTLPLEAGCGNGIHMEKDGEDCGQGCRYGDRSVESKIDGLPMWS
eukprot:3277446-Pleurochrysis_carterae.AAC.5